MEKNQETLVQYLKNSWEFEEEIHCEHNEKEGTLRVTLEGETQGVTISLGPLLAKWERDGDSALHQVLYYVHTTFRAAKENHEGPIDNSTIFPIIRSTSFPLENGADEQFIWDEHTAETRIFYVTDTGNSYRLLTDEYLKRSGILRDKVIQHAYDNVKKLATNMKKDTVANNHFYFISTNDGYDASRILNTEFLRTMKENVQGEMVVAVPHNDVCIVGDIVNEAGYDVLAQIAMSFFMKGKTPITALSFSYDGEKLEPIFILGKKK